MKFKEIIFLVFLVAAGILFTHLQTGKLDGDIYLGEDIFYPQDVFTHQSAREVEAPLPEHIEITNPDGSIHVEPSAQNRIRIKLEKNIRHRSESEAAKIAAQLKISVSRVGNRLQISTNRGDFERTPFKAHLSVSLPAESKVTIKNTSGDVRVFGVKEADISSRYGDITAAQIKENLIVENRHHDVEVDQVGGRCTVESTGAEIRIQQVEGGAAVQTRYGQVDLENIKNGAEISGLQTRITAKYIQGLLDIRSSYKPVNIQETGPVKIEAKQSDITAADISGSLEIKNQYARIRVDHIRGPFLDIRGKSVAVNADDVKSDEIYLSSSYRDILLSDFKGKTTVIHSNGKVSLYPDGTVYPVQVQGEISDIYFYRSGEEDYLISAQAESGKINWNLLEKPETVLENGTTIMKSFSGDNPERMVSLFTKYGTIWVETVKEKRGR